MASIFASKLLLRTPAKVVAGDALLGTQQLLLEATRSAITGEYKAAIASSGAGALATGLITNSAFLDRAGFFEDFSRDNDISWYEVGKAKKGVDESGEEYAWVTQDRGFKHLVPRDLVSPGEKRDFSLELQKFAISAARGGAGEVLVGATLNFEDGATLVGSTLHCQVSAAVDAGADFITVQGVTAPSAIAELNAALEANATREVVLVDRNFTGFATPQEHPTTIGADFEAVVIAENASDAAAFASEAANFSRIGVATVGKDGCAEWA